VYADDDYAMVRREHINHVLTRFPWIAVVDAFQHWLYTDPAATDRDARDRKFVEIWAEYDPHTNWTGLDDLRTARWYKQLHIFLYPFYYIEYGLAQLAAVQVWRNAQHDPETALADLRAAFALGGTKPLPELYARAGARMIFDEAGMSDLVNLVVNETEKSAIR
ncbi:MAG TPA: M3 family metallopeptidase, partial [Thermomicrobiales bacterium]|nr:M3 family metallopeptidase [Thermomicrobiales bacterium]